MTLSRWMAIVLMASSAEAVAAAPIVDGLYRGQIAGKNVIVLIGAPDKDEAFLGHYAYLHVGAALELSGTVKGDTASIEERAGHETTGQWSGTFSKSGFRGRWTARDGKRVHDIILVRQIPGDGKGHAVEAGRKRPRKLEEIYDREIARRNLVGKDEVVVGDVAYHMVLHTQADVSYPRLTRHPDEKVLARINAALEKLHQDSVAEALRCSPALDPSYMDVVCRREAVIPLAELIPFRKPGSTYRFE